ncbi:MAG: 50S ribosomal protein L32 [Desulfobacteraceae bacterium]|jgi:large subunit ribosomal protein L32|nr:50S ribosomal protein L32 [Desulfobacteraceae bacterium]
MALPKRKKSKSKRDMRRAHQKLAGPNLSECPQCGEKKLPHHACPGCGDYKGRTVVETEEL